MASIREKVIGQINRIEDEEFLEEVYKLLHGMQETREVLYLNDEQRLMVKEAREAYKRGGSLSSEDTFSDLVDDED